MAIFDLKANIDLKQNLNLYTTCKQLDSLNLILSVFDNSVQTDLANYNVRLKAMKADKVPLIQEHAGISINSNVIKIETDEQLTTTSGKTLIELQLIDKETGKKKATFNLVLIVVSNALEVDRSISKATYTLLEELENKLDKATDYFINLEKVEKLNNEMKESITTGTTLDTSLKGNITTGTTLDTSLKGNITAGNTANDNLKTTTEESKTSKTQLDESIKKANDFITANGNISEIVTKVDQNTKDIANISNHNLLINGDFQIWQRGTEFNCNTDVNYCADRWVLAGDTSPTAKKTEKGILITTTKVGTWTNFCYKIEDDYFKKLVGEKATLTFKTSSPTNDINLLWCNGRTIDDKEIYHVQDNRFTSENTDTFSVTFDIKQVSVKTEIGAQLKSDKIGREVEFVWVKLEVGEKATTFIPKSYGDELLACQRFYEIVDNIRFINNSTNVARLAGSFDYKVTKRIEPTLKITPDDSGYNGKNELKLEAESSTHKEVTVWSNKVTGASVIDLIDATGVTGGSTLVGRLYADAEIY